MIYSVDRWRRESFLRGGEAVRKFILCYRIIVSLDTRELYIYYYIWFLSLMHDCKVSLHGMFANKRFVDPNSNYTYLHTLVHPGWTGNERMTLLEYFLHPNMRNFKPQVL